MEAALTAGGATAQGSTPQQKVVPPGAVETASSTQEEPRSGDESRDAPGTDAASAMRSLGGEGDSCEVHRCEHLSVKVAAGMFDAHIAAVVQLGLEDFVAHWDEMLPRPKSDAKSDARNLAGSGSRSAPNV